VITIDRVDDAKMLVDQLRELDRITAIAASKTGGGMYVQIQGRAYDDITDDVRPFVLGSLGNKRAGIVSLLRELGVVEVEQRHAGPA
jgi:hypothetical protein